MTTRTALITGASRGLGRALARSLAADGWRLVIDARRPFDLHAVAAELPGAVAIPGDVADPSHRGALRQAVADLGQLDLLVNNASTLGVTPLPTLRHHRLDVLRQVFEVNVVAPLALTQLLLPQLRRAGGTVLNITSDAAVEAYGGWGGYGSSKAALEQLSRVLAVEEDGLRVYSFDPGDMRTQMHQDAFAGEDISDRPEPETVVPAIRRLLDTAPASGRYRAADLSTVPA
jgi:NAD(P)-dependent dehydrogenase (short-subunit alcohol dehydrogenase family)